MKKIFIIFLLLVSTLWADNGLKLGTKHSFFIRGDFKISVQSSGGKALIQIPDQKAEKYGIYRKDPKALFFKKIALINDLSYLDNNSEKGAQYGVIALLKQKNKKKGSPWIIKTSSFAVFQEKFSEKKDKEKFEPNKQKNKIEIEKDYKVRENSEITNSEFTKDKKNSGNKKVKKVNDVKKIKTIKTVKTVIIKDKKKYQKMSQKEIDKIKKKPIKIEQRRTKAKVRITSAPGKANVYINNQLIGKTPIIKDMKLGVYQVSLKKEGYAFVQIPDFTVSLGKTVHTNVKLFRITAGIVVTTVPPQANIYLNGKNKGKSPVEFKKLPYGKYTIKASLQGYVNTEQAFQIDSEKSRAFNLILQKKTGGLTVTSIPSGAIVRLDGVKRGTTPVELKGLPVGMHRLKLSKDNYSTIKKEIILEKDIVKNMNFTLLKTKAHITIASSPSAFCFLNGQAVGATPIIQKEVESGSYRILLQKPGYLSVEKIVTLKPGDSIVENLPLSIAPSSISISSMPDKTTLKINGSDYGTTPFTSDEMSPGAYTLVFEKEGYKTLTKKVILNSGQKQDVKVQLIPVVNAPPPIVNKNDVLTLTSIPENAQVFINNQFVGNSPASVTLPSGQYFVELKLNNYENWSSVIDLAESENKNLNIPLKAVQKKLILNSVPAGASISIDGMQVGQTPKEFFLDPKSYVVTLTKTGYDTLSETVILDSALPQTVKTYNLKKSVVVYKFESSPSGAEVSLVNQTQGKIIGITPFSLNDLKAGTYNFRFKKNGYRAIAKSFVIQNGQPAVFSAVLTPLQGNLFVQNSIGQAQVYVDNRFVGNTGAILKNISAGYHTVSVRKFGYFNFNTSTQILDQKLTSVTAQLIEKPKGNLHISSTPPNAKIYFNGAYLGLTPYLLNKYPEGQYSLRLKLKGYKTYRATASIVGNQTQNFNATLIEGSDCCLNVGIFGKPITWYIGSALAIAGSGYSWYMSEKARDSGNHTDYIMYRDLRDNLAIVGGACLSVGFAIDLFN